MGSFMVLPAIIAGSTVNGVPAKGASISGPGPTIAGGMFPNDSAHLAR